MTQPDDDAELGTDGPAPSVVVFDVGEVLIDETRVWAVWAELLGVSPFTLMATLGAAIVQGEDYPAAREHVAPNMDADALQEAHEERYGGFREEDLYPDVRPCLQDLVSAGFRVAICGNQPGRRRRQLLDLDLGAEFVATSEDLGADKPDPAFFDAVLDHLGVPPHEVLYVGDRVDNDVLPASDHGLRTCWLRRGPWALLQEVPEDVEVDLVLEGLGELPTLLTAWREPTVGA